MWSNEKNANIENCYNLANLETKNISGRKLTSNTACGGITGQFSVENKENNEIGNIQRCFNYGNIKVNGGNNQVVDGGIIGAKTEESNRLNINSCYNNSELQVSTSSITNNALGGIAGMLSVTNISNCYNIGNIIVNKEKNTTTEEFLGIGGIIGRASTTEINNVFNIGKIIIEKGSTDLKVGGIIGGAGNNDINIIVNNAYNEGKIEEDISVSGEQIGSISGNNSITFNNCYYLKGTYDVGVGGSETVTGVSQLDSIDKFPNVLEVINGDNAFKEDSNNINNGYPILEWQ